jgi:hypothetical protein
MQWGMDASAFGVQGRLAGDIQIVRKLRDELWITVIDLAISTLGDHSPPISALLQGSLCSVIDG